MSEAGSHSRRTLFQRAMQALAGLAIWRGLQPALAEHAASTETGPLTMRVMRPYDAETPVREFTSFLTPNHRFFVRSHFGPPAPELIAEANWKLRVGGLVERSLEFTLKELRQLEAVTITAVVQCSGNGRAFHRPKVPGVQWERGAVGNAEWTGVRLRDLLAKAGVRGDAHHVQLQGADRPVVASVPLFTRSIPLEKALHPDTILAYEMNGRPLPLLHGAPLRVITPGWMADSCTKWLTEITVQADEAKGYYMQTAYRVPARPVEVGTTPKVPSNPVEAMVVKSLIAAPQEGGTVKVGPVAVQGVAWSGEAKVVKVEVSIDEGKTWEPARLVGEDTPYAWRQWQWVWKAGTAGTATILCRATDARGETQPATTPWNPSGFLWNGWDRVSVTVTA
ncbi:MAG TPA: sulfite oxidase [Nitrospiraceae bacterium]|nr:sulfite oxidase [Nitrospiraceae bacterium]